MLSHTFRIALLASAAIAPAPAFAQAQAAGRPAPSPAVSNEASAAIGEVVVTARRREERLQDVPVAVSAVAGNQLQRLSIIKADDLPRVAPGMVVTTSVYGASNLTVTIRSQRQQLNNGTYDASVGVYFDEVPQARTQGLNAGFFDLQSVQVLKGPQGTLFGRNTTGGAVLITSAPPTREFEGYGQVTAGNYGLNDYEAALNLPVNDQLQLRFAGKATRRDGEIYSTAARERIGNLNDYSWRMSAKWTPTENLTNSLVVNGFHELDDGIVFKLVAVNPNSNAARNRDQLSQLQSLNGLGFWSTTAAPTHDGTHIDATTISNITTYDLGGVTLKNIFGYRRTSSDILFNIQGDANTTYLIDTIDNGKQYSDEVNVSGRALDNHLEYFGGLFYFKEDNASAQVTTNKLAQPVTATGPGVIGLALADPIKNTSYSAYGSATYHIGESGWSVTGGVRLTHDKREVTWKSRFITPAAACRLVDAAAQPLSPCVRTSSVSYSKPTFTATIDYKPAVDFLFYGTYRRGYRSGGFTFTATNPFEAAPYRPEIVDDFEIGHKGLFRFGDEVRLRYDVAAYYDDYKDIQRQLTDATKPVVSVYFVNAAAAHIKGFEASADLEAGRLSLSGSFSLSDAHYTRFVVPGPGGVITDYTDAPLAGAPKYTATWLARYQLLDSDSAGQVFGQIGGYYQSDTVAQDATSYDVVNHRVFPQDVVRHHHVVDARLEWADVLRHPLNIQLFVRNLTRAKYYAQINDSSTSTTFGSGGAILNEPRTYGVVLKYTF